MMRNSSSLNELVVARPRGGADWPVLKACKAQHVDVPMPLARYSLVRISAAMRGTVPVPDTPISDRLFNLIAGTGADDPTSDDYSTQSTQAGDPGWAGDAAQSVVVDSTTIAAMKASLTEMGFTPLADPSERTKSLPHLAPFDEEPLFSEELTVVPKQRQLAMEHVAAEFTDGFCQKKYVKTGGHSDGSCAYSRNPCELHKLRQQLRQTAEEEARRDPRDLNSVLFDEYGLPMHNQRWVRKKVPTALASGPNKHDPLCRKSLGVDSRRAGVMCTCKTLRQAKMNAVNDMIVEFTGRVRDASCETPRLTSNTSPNGEPTSSLHALVAPRIADVRPTTLRPNIPRSTKALSIQTTSTDNKSPDFGCPLLSPKETRVVLKPRSVLQTPVRHRTIKLSPLPPTETATPGELGNVTDLLGA
jgi:hypothetical protein